MSDTGRRIRELRQLLSLSQQQLAGREMSRAFISQVEAGKCMPSPETLRIIAQRLGKPVEYFLHGTDVDESMATAIALLESAERDLAQKEDTLVPLAERKLQKVREYAECLERKELEARSRLLLVTCLRRQRKYEEMLAECERAVDCYKGLNDPRCLALIYRETGDACMHLEDFAAAHRAYEKAVLYASGLKTMQPFFARTLMFLASCLSRMGQFPLAIARYKEAFEASVDDPPLQADIAMGLGVAYFRTGDYDTAKSWTLKAIAVYERFKSPNCTFARHNLAAVEFKRGNQEQAYTMLRECLSKYQAEGRVDKQAYVLEELAHYFLHKQDLSRAETICWKALDLLELKNDGLVRGKIYRLLGLITRQKGHHAQARNLFRISYDMLRRLKATFEAEQSLAELEKSLAETPDMPPVTPAELDALVPHRRDSDQQEL